MLVGAFLTLYMIVSCAQIGSLDSAPVNGTSWLSRSGTLITFFHDGGGNITIDNKFYSISFEQEKAFIQLTVYDGINSNTLLEMSQMKEDRMYCVSVNQYFYEITNQTF